MTETRHHLNAAPTTEPVSAADPMTDAAHSQKRRDASLPLGDRIEPQTLARWTGILFLVTYATSIPALLLFGPVLNDPAYITGPGVDTQIVFASFLEVILIVANVGSALALYPILKRQNGPLALGFVATRIIESVFIAVGLLSMLAVTTLRQGAAGADPATLVVAGQALVAIKDWTFLLGPGFVVGIGNGIILSYLMYRSGLLPRGLVMLGLLAGPLLCLAGIGLMFGVIEFGSPWQVVATIPEFFWELGLGLYLTIWGFRSAPILAGRAG